MQSFTDKLAVVTGAGAGMGRELALALAADGCHLALCDISTASVQASAALCREAAPQGGAAQTISAHTVDVADEGSVLRLRDEVASTHATDHVHLLFNNAGIAGGGSFVKAPRDEWERTFSVCWLGVYHCARAFLPLLIAAPEARMVNTSSINGFWASLGPDIEHTAYCAAKFAVKGFSEALITDLRLNAPHVEVSVVMPGHIGTDIAANTERLHGRPVPDEMSAAEIAVERERLVARGRARPEQSDDEIREILRASARKFRDSAPTSAREAARIILDGVRARRWRILVGADAHAIDRLVRAAPEDAYEQSLVDALAAEGHLQSLVRRRPRSR